MSSANPYTANDRPTTNLERWYQTRYAMAHDLLKDNENPYAAEEAFKELLQEANMPLWMRVQCNLVVANLADEPAEARTFLADAKEVLELFVEEMKYKYNSLEECPHKDKIERMKEKFVEAEEGIEARRNGWDNTEDEPTESSTGEQAEEADG